MQYSRPNSTVASATWGFVGGSFFGAIGEVVADDTDYIWASAGGSITDAEVGLSAVSDPSSSSDHTVYFRYSTTTVPPYAAPNELTVSLYEGATLIASDTVEPTGTITTGSFTLSGPEADAITDYSALSLRFGYNYGGFGDEIRIYQAYLEVPDAGAGTGGFAVTWDAPPVCTMRSVTRPSTGREPGFMVTGCDEFGFMLTDLVTTDYEVPSGAKPVSREDALAGKICSASGMWFPRSAITYVDGRPYGRGFVPKSRRGGVV